MPPILHPSLLCDYVCDIGLAEISGPTNRVLFCQANKFIHSFIHSFMMVMIALALQLAMMAFWQNPVSMVLWSSVIVVMRLPNLLSALSP